MKEAFIVSAVRTAVGKAPKGTLRDTRADEMGAAVIKEAMARVPGLEAAEIEDVIMGCAMPEAEQGMNIARSAAIRAGLPVETSAMTINRFCSSGLPIDLPSRPIEFARAVRRWHSRVAGIDVDDSHGRHIIRPNPYLVEHYPDFYLNMGLATENVARKYEVTREEQDEFALRSHQRAFAALEQDKFKEETVPLTVTVEELDNKGKKQHREVIFDKDEGPRRDTSAEALGKLKPAFHVKGTITAGNSSQMSDGAAVAVVMSEDRAKEFGREASGAFCRLRGLQGVRRKRWALVRCSRFRKVLKLAGLTLDQIDVIELNEAFAAQSLAVIKTLGLDLDQK